MLIFNRSLAHNKVNYTKALFKVSSTIKVLTAPISDIGQSLTLTVYNSVFGAVYLKLVNLQQYSDIDQYDWLTPVIDQPLQCSMLIRKENYLDEVLC